VLQRPAEESADVFRAPAKRPPHRPEKDATQIAINGIDYDPDEVHDLPAEGDA
jgi:hypothetical protein